MIILIGKKRRQPVEHRPRPADAKPAKRILRNAARTGVRIVDRDGFKDEVRDPM